MFVFSNSTGAGKKCRLSFCWQTLMTKQFVQAVMLFPLCVCVWNRASGCMHCWRVWRSLCCLKPTPSSDSWPGDVPSSAALWYSVNSAAVNELAIDSTRSSEMEICFWKSVSYYFKCQCLLWCVVSPDPVSICPWCHRKARRMRDCLPSTCSSASLPGIYHSVHIML